MWSRPGGKGANVAAVLGRGFLVEVVRRQEDGRAALGAQTLVEVAAMPDPPTRLYLGKDALHAILRATEAEHADAERYAELSRSISH